jgi:hypothetical protein
MRAEGFGGYQNLKLANIPKHFGNGEERTFPRDGDEVTLTGRCYHAGFVSIGFGGCRGEIVGSLR